MNTYLGQLQLSFSCDRQGLLIARRFTPAAKLSKSECQSRVAEQLASHLLNLTRPQLVSWLLGETVSSSLSMKSGDSPLPLTE